MALGDIGSVRSTLEFDTDFANFQCIVKVSNTIALIFYGEAASDQKVYAFEVNPALPYALTFKDSLTWNGGWSGYNSICKRADNLFVCAYRGMLDHVTTKGHLSSILCGNDGAIPASTEDDAVLFTADVLWTSVLNLAGNVIVVAFKDDSNNGVLKTFIVNAAGAITEPRQDEFEFEPAICHAPHVIKISDSVVAVVYSDASSHGQLFTMAIDSFGNIAPSKKDNYAFDTDKGIAPKICHVSGDIYAIAYTGWGTVGYLRTVAIDSEGNITKSIKGEWTTGAVEGNVPAIIKVSDSIVAGVYYDTGDAGQLFTIGIDAAGLIDAGPIDTLKFEATQAFYNDLVHMQGNIYLISYQGPDNDGFVVSVDIETPVLKRPHHEIMMGIGP